MTLPPKAATIQAQLRELGIEREIIHFPEGVHTAKAAAAALGIEHVRANALESEGGRLTGRVRGAVVDRRAKEDFLRDLAQAQGIPLERCVAIGDGANDLDMLSVAGLGVAYNAKPVVRDAADTAVNVPYLDTILYLLGISREEIEVADAEAGLTTPAPPV